MPLERRQSFRTGLSTQVRLRHDGSAPQLLLTNDLGPRGVFLRSVHPIGLNEPVSLEILLPGEDAPVEAEGRVAWAHRGRGSGDRAGMGIRFTRVGNDSAVRLTRFFSAHRAAAGKRVVLVTDEAPLLRPLVRSLAKEGLRPQVLKWSDALPRGGAPVAAFVVVPNDAEQSPLFSPYRVMHGRRPAIVALVERADLFKEWVGVATLCLHGLSEPERICALVLAVAGAGG